FIATHGHFVFETEQKLYRRPAPIIEWGVKSEKSIDLLVAALNSALALFWLKQICFNKGAGEDEERDRFEFTVAALDRLHVAPRASTVEVEARFARAQEIRDKLRREMIARQEEMDWVVYAAYGLIDEAHPAAASLTADVDLTLDRDERPFRFYAKADGDFDK